MLKGEDNSFKNLTVLVADSLDSLRSTVVAVLTEFGFKRVLQASNGNEALNLIQKHQIDLIISETQLSKMDGVELLRKVRLDPKTNKTPFVMTSTTIEQAEVVRAIKNGVSEYVVKPFSAKILTQRIKRAIANPIKQTASFVKAQSGVKEEQKPQKLKVLVVDDIPDNIDVISELLKSDYKIKAATSGELALKICASKQPPDLILLDIMMPGMDGMEVCKRLKENSKTQHITIIFLTALDQTEDIVKGLELGAVDYITKPIQPPVVKARVKTHCNVIEGQKQMRDQVDTLMEMARMKEEFDRISKNDLKQPIEEISKYLNFMDRNLRDPGKITQSAGAIKCSVSQLTQMVDNMLSLSKIEEGTYQLVPVMLNVAQLVQNVCSTFATTSNHKKIQVKNNIQDNIQIDCEELLTISLLSNLLKNAIEAAPHSSTITFANESVDNFHTVTLHNEGDVPEEIRDVFFDKHVSSGKKEGAGIGTFAAKLMAEVQQGKIAFTTSRDAGTTLKVSLPKT